MRQTKGERIIALMIALLILVFNSSYAQESIGKSLLWEVSGNGLAKSSYLYGTIHVICPDDLNIDDRLQLYFGKCEQLTLEIDLDDPRIITLFNQLSLMDNGTKLSELLTGEEYQKIENFFLDSLRLNLSFFENMKPALLGTFMYGKMLGCSPASYEQALLNLAKEANIDTNGLESVEFQMSIFDTIPYKKQAKLLWESIEKYEENRLQLQKAIEIYLTEDLNKTIELMRSSAMSMEEFEDTLLANRNIKWIETIKKMMNEKPTFFAFGAAHLPGEKGVINLLLKEGFDVTPIYK